MEIVVRKALRNEAEIIHQFMLAMAFETEGIKLNDEALSFGINAAMDDPNKAIYFVAELGNKVVGSLMITKEWSDWRGKWIWWIQSVYTLPEYRKKGVYKALYNHILKIIKDDPNIGGIRLYVDKTNVVAQQVYNKLGMNGEHYQLFEWMK